MKRYEAAGLVDETPPPLHDPVDPAAGGLSDARSWCRWCGHRVIVDGDRWVHHVSDGPPRGEGVLEVADCPGDEPWPGVSWLTAPKRRAMLRLTSISRSIS